MKKNIIRILIICIISAMAILCFASCGAHETEKKESKLKVIATIYPQYDFAKHIGGDKADVTMLVKPGTEAHSFEPSPQDMKKIQNCDLFIYTGGENDEWVEKLIKSFGNKGPKVLKMTDVVDTVEEESVEGMESEKDDDKKEDQHDVDEHVWTSPTNAIKICEKINSEMGKLDKKNKKYFDKNCLEYTKQIEKVDSEIENLVKKAPHKTILVGDRFPLRYFVDRYGLEYYAAFPGCSDQTEANASTIAFLIDKAKAENIPVVFQIELSNGKIADTISEATGAKKMTIYTCHNISSDMYKEGISYVDMMKKNEEALKKALYY